MPADRGLGESRNLAQIARRPKLRLPGEGAESRRRAPARRPGTAGGKVGKDAIEQTISDKTMHGEAHGSRGSASRTPQNPYLESEYQRFMNLR